MADIRDFDAVDDYGMKTTDGLSPDYMTLEDFNIVNVDVNEGTTRKYDNLETILSGGTYQMTLSANVRPDQAKLALNYDSMTSLAKLGSAYSYVSRAINNVRDEYPNGFLIYTGTVSTQTFMFSMDQTYWYGLEPNIPNFTQYKLIETNTSTESVIAEYTINSYMKVGNNWMLFLDGTPSVGPDIDYIVCPDDAILGEYYKGLSQYERDLLYPPADRYNYWPKDTLAPTNLLFEGDDYDEFVEDELKEATTSDNDYSNIMWRKLYPDGQKILDTDDATMQRLVLTFAMNFDTIMRYQEHLKYLHTIGYENYDHIPRELVHLLADQWGWTLSHNLSTTDYSRHMFSVYENYITGYTQQKLSGEDINFEMWRRVLSSLVHLYKKKGTEEAIKYLMNLFSIPESLIDIEELVYGYNNSAKKELLAAPSNIVYTKSDRLLYYVDQYGSESAYDYQGVENTKYLSIHVSPSSAIEFDYYAWAQDAHVDVVDVNGDVFSISGLNGYNQLQFMREVNSRLIRSDGFARYETHYPLLENEATIYYRDSLHQFSYASFEPYIEFLDDNWNLIMSELVPASSKLVSSGTFFRNNFWNREKFTWQESDLEAKPLPFNTGYTFTIQPVVEYQSKHSVAIDPMTKTGSMEIKKDATIDSMTFSSLKKDQHHGYVSSPNIVGGRNSQYYGLAETFSEGGEYVPTIDDTLNFSMEMSGGTFSMDAPYIVPFTSATLDGTLEVVEFDADAAVSTNYKILSIPFSANNLSESGYTEMRFDLFRLDRDRVELDTGNTYSILSVSHEGSRYGYYRVSSTEGLEELMSVKIQSDYLPYLNDVVRITNIDTTTNEIRTEPKIGLFDLPMGENGSAISWLSYATSPAFNLLRAMNVDMGFTLYECKTIINHVLNSAQLTFISYLASLGDKAAYSFIFNEWINMDKNYLYASLILLEFIIANHRQYNLNMSAYVLINAVATSATKATFNRIVEFFDWGNPNQVVIYNNDGTQQSGDWDFPIIDMNNVGPNNVSLTGTIQLGGLDELNSELMKDKYEYFYRYKVATTAHSGWTWDEATISNYSGVDLIDSGYYSQVINDIPYYGRYFIYFNKPNEPEISTGPANLIDGGAAGLTVYTSETSSVSVSWRGVGDSDRLEIQFYPTGDVATTIYDYTGITSSNWTSTGITVPVNAVNNTGDDYIYTIQTSLQPNTYYWWRIRNFRSKLNIFGNNIEAYTNTQPRFFRTGDFDESGAVSGEIPDDPTPPPSGGKYELES